LETEMNFPWTSRERLNEAQARIAELAAEVKALRDKNEYLVNQIVWRQSSVALDPNLLPEQYRPKTTPTVSAPQGDALNDPPQKAPISGSGPSRSRQMLRDVEKKLENEFIHATTGVNPGPVVMTRDDRKAQAEVLSKLNESANEGLKDAAKVQEA
jgi:hypothetical protein